MLRVLLNRYLTDDFGYATPAKNTARVPRFLLNDIVRYWRTMAVDFAAKRRERQGKGWPLRNFKLRLSRKLIFAAGLVATLSCQLRPPRPLTNQGSQTEEDYATMMTDYLLHFTNTTPLDAVAGLASEFKASDAIVRDIFEAYDAFLGILGDDDERRKLDSLTPDAMWTDRLFAHTREIGNRFQAGLSGLFFDTNPKLTDAAKRYGVF